MEKEKLEPPTPPATPPQAAAPQASGKAGALTPEEREKLRRDIIEQLEQDADKVDMSDKEEEILFYIAYKSAS